MKFSTLIALVGAASAYHQQACGACPQPAPACPQPAPACDTCGAGYNANAYAGKRLSRALDASARLPAASYGNDNYARLCTEAANSNTQISAS
jgi:hypothetical protein